MPDILPWKDPQQPHPDLVYGQDVIATSEPHATEAGLDAFRNGGNAVDAILAAAITLTVTEPNSNGIGSDGFSIVARKGKLNGLNASGKLPANWKPGNLATWKEMPERGWDTVTVPGAVSQWVALHERFGKLPFAGLFRKAICCARDGFPLGTRVAAGFRQARKTFKDFPEFNRTFFPGGFEPKPGAIFRNPDQADTLREIAETRGESFYRGRLARRIAQYARETGGWITEEDLAGHTPIPVDPVAADYRGYTVHELPPNGQGLVALIAFGILEHFPLDKWDPDSPDSIHVKVEALKIGFAEGFRHICDPDHWNPAAFGLLEPDYLRKRAGDISLKVAGRPEATPFQDQGTVCLAAADREGTMVSFIQSSFMGFGSGIVIPDTGIALQNRGAGFTLEPGHPNQAAPGKRPYHTIIPAMVSRGAHPCFAFGVMGGYLQPQGHVQVLTRILDNGWNPQASSDAPRWFVTPDFGLELETGFDPAVIEALKQRGHDVSVNDKTEIFGGHQGVFKLASGYSGSSDHRKDGHAAALN